VENEVDTKWLLNFSTYRIKEGGVIYYIGAGGETIKDLARGLLAISKSLIPASRNKGA
jgi:hypothetical protein